MYIKSKLRIIVLSFDGKVNLRGALCVIPPVCFHYLAIAIFIGVIIIYLVLLLFGAEVSSLRVSCRCAGFLPESEDMKG